jgi:hypothetical protein
MAILGKRDHDERSTRAQRTSNLLEIAPPLQRCGEKVKQATIMPEVKTLTRQSSVEQDGMKPLNAG